MALTPRQAKVLELIRESQLDRGYAPTMEELGKALGVSPVTAHEHVRALEAKGFIRTEPRRARSIEIVEEESAPKTPPVLGRIAAGLPIEAMESPEPFELETLFPSDRECFLLEVKGHSMIEDHIQDGDLVVVESRPSAQPGDTVVALIRGEEATLKRFYPEGPKVRLEPANASMSSIIVAAEDVTLQGIVIGVIRRFT